MIKRPLISDEIKIAAANTLSKNENHGIESEHIAKVYKNHDDGYDLAKKLECEYGYDLDAEAVDFLDGMSCIVRKLHQKACWQWVKDNDIQPKHEIGSHIYCVVRDRAGVIVGVSEHEPACYLVEPINPTDEEVRQKARWIIRFEDYQTVF